MVCLDNGCPIDSALISDIVVNCPSVDLMYIAEMKILLDKYQINLSDAANDVLSQLANHQQEEYDNEKTPFENKICSRFLSNTKSTHDRTFDTNSVKKKNYKM